MRDLQLNHVKEKFVAKEVSSRGKEVREEQPFHAPFNPFPFADEVLINGNDVREEQPFHALPKFVPDEVSISGKDVREEQPLHACVKFVTLPNALLAAAPLSTKYCSIEVISLSLRGDEETR